LDSDVAVAGFLRDLLRLIENLGELRRDVDLSCASARYLRHLGKRLLNAGESVFGASARAGDQPSGQTFAIIEQHFKEMLRCQPLMAFAKSKRLSRLKEALGPIGQILEIHGCPNGRGARPLIRGRGSINVLIYGTIGRQEKVTGHACAAKNCQARALPCQRIAGPGEITGSANQARRDALGPGLCHRKWKPPLRRPKSKVVPENALLAAHAQ